MTNDTTRPYRPAAIFVLLGLLAVAGCQGMKGGAGGVGASASGAMYLTSIRTDHGLPPLSPDRRLEKAAAQQAGYMASASSMMCMPSPDSMANTQASSRAVFARGWGRSSSWSAG